MTDIDKLGLFYLGRRFDPLAGQPTDEPLLYDAKDLTTHAVCVGMTGSGKTGLCVALLEEAAIDGIPALVIDPKGDLGNLLLAFPNLQPADFRPWIDTADAARRGLSPNDVAARTADSWRTGLAQWGQDAARIGRYRQAVDLAIYTPGSTAGRPLNVLRSFDAPPAALLADSTARRDRILSAVSGLLTLVGIDADPLQSREHILLATILEHAWSHARNLDLAAIIRDVQKPPFAQIGVFDLDSFFPARERFSLAMALNNLLASPGFSVWMQGEPLDIQRLLYTASGQPRLTVLSIAHLSDAERMFFVTMLLNEVLAWMRQQSGTSSLRALLYMDEIFGYFPPTANPPSKLPMLTLLKQARAFGLGVVLSTQNPVDLDYKGLANAGTWFIGRLQTERDKARVIDGLESALAGAGAALDRAETEATLAALGNRVFLMRNVHDDAPTLFQTRWALSYLRGPLTLPQIQQLTGLTATAQTASAAPVASAVAFQPAPTPAKPVLPPDVDEYYQRAGALPAGATCAYRPAALGTAQVHFVDARAAVDTWQTLSFVAPLAEDGREALWAEASRHADLKPSLERAPAPGATFAALPPAAASAKTLAAWSQALERFIQQTVSLDLPQCPALKLSARPGEAEGDFRARLALAMREYRDAEIDKIRRKFAPRLATAQAQLQRAMERVAREKEQLGQQRMTTAISVGATILGALFGGGRRMSRSITGTAAAMKSAGRIGREAGDVNRAEESVETVQARLSGLQAELEQEVARLQGELDPAQAALVTTVIRPRKSDISVAPPAVVWVPWITGPDGLARPASA
ncbi:MAG: DUF87 domain-containing protein [Lentisphaerae bacterium]|nr:DUF87 domain-containing protein [Lentisphaerota bacterium]